MIVSYVFLQRMCYPTVKAGRRLSWLGGAYYRQAYCNRQEDGKCRKDPGANQVRPGAVEYHKEKIGRGVGLRKMAEWST